MNNAFTKDILLLLGIVFICFLSVWLFTRPAILPIFDLSNFGTIGDAIGGLTAPVIGGIGAYLVFKSFRAQQEANKLQFEALLDQKRFDALTNIYHEFRDDCKDVVKKLESKPKGITAYDNLHLVLTEAFGTDKYSTETLRNINELRGLTSHIWSFHDPISQLYKKKPYGERIKDTAMFILINKFLNIYETHIAGIFDKIIDEDLSSPDGQVLVHHLKSAQEYIGELKDLATYTS